MTPQTLRDHIALLSPSIPLYEPLVSSRQSNSSNLSDKGKIMANDTALVLVTMSGLIGTVKEYVLMRCRVLSILNCKAPP
jgi:hypothetical protein